LRRWPTQLAGRFHTSLNQFEIVLRSLYPLLILVAAVYLTACVPAPATIPSPQIPSPLPSPNVPMPSDGMPSPPSVPGLPSPSSDGDGGLPSPPTPLPGDGEPGDSGNQASKGDAEGGQVVLEEGDEGDAQADAEGNGGAQDESNSEDVSLEDIVAEEETEPTFEEPTFEESAESDTSSQSGGLSQATLEELERVLEQELGTFDSTVQREQRNAEEQSSQPASGGSGPVIVFEDYPEQQQGSGSSGGGSGSGSGEGESAGGGSSSDVTVAVEDARVPPPNPDDDIVARQLREAAIAETDPELKQRLWEEYYRYTGTQ
jgi:hypothetical protein